jgi:hypothetical protein
VVGLSPQQQTFSGTSSQHKLSPKQSFPMGWQMVAAKTVVERAERKAKNCMVGGRLVAGCENCGVSEM